MRHSLAPAHKPRPHHCEAAGPEELGLQLLVVFKTIFCISKGKEGKENKELSYLLEKGEQQVTARESTK